MVLLIKIILKQSHWLLFCLEVTLVELTLKPYHLHITDALDSWSILLVYELQVVGEEVELESVNLPLWKLLRKKTGQDIFVHFIQFLVRDLQMVKVLVLIAPNNLSLVRALSLQPRHCYLFRWRPINHFWREEFWSLQESLDPFFLLLRWE